MIFTSLDRQFRKWRSDKADEEDFRLFEQSFYGDAGWSELLKYQRVVILAEGGSGKSAELEQQAKGLTEAGEFTVHASVQRVAERGLYGALKRAAQARFDDWRKSDKQCWFFIDSFDEAKLDDIRLVEAFRRVADDLGTSLPRARIIFSGRYSNWEFRTDLKHLEQALPLAEKMSVLPDDGAHPIVRLIRVDEGKQGKKSAPEKPLVVLMAPLDPPRVRKFAEGQGVTDVDAFISALDAANLWHLAQRPLDLSWLVDYWQRHKRFGPLAEMLETSLRARLRETDVSRSRRDAIDEDRAFHALERIGAAIVFGRRHWIEVPDSTPTFERSNQTLKLSDILPDWSGDHQGRLWTRPVFDPAALGQVGLHNDNHGVVRAYLAARWLDRRLAANVSRAKLRDLLFSDADGVPIVLPSMRETVAWLSLRHPDIAQEVARREPWLLLTAGDPGSLSAAVRVAALRGLVAQLAQDGKRLDLLDRDSLRRVATADLVLTINELWRQHSDREEVRKLLLILIEAGRLVGCAPIAVEAVSGTFSNQSTLLYGARALAVTAGAEAVRRFVASVTSKGTAVDQTVLWETVELFFPRHISVSDLLSTLAENERLGEAARDLSWRSRDLSTRLTSSHDLEKLLQGLMDLVPLTRIDDHASETDGSGRRRLAPLVQSTASRLLGQAPFNEASLVAVEAAIWLSRGQHHHPRRFEDESFEANLNATSERRRAGLWHSVEKVRNHPWLEKAGGLWNLNQLGFVGWSPNLSQEDIGWLLDDAQKSDDPLHRRFAISALLDLQRHPDSPYTLLDQIRSAAALDNESAAMVEARLAPRKLSAEEAKLERTIAQQQRRRLAEQEKATSLGLISLMASRPILRSFERHHPILNRATSTAASTMSGGYCTIRVLIELTMPSIISVSWQMY